MQETRCRQCGATFTTVHPGAVCPYCGTQPSSRLRDFVSFLAMHWVLFALIAAFIAIERPSAPVWAVIGLFAALVALGVVCFGMGRATKVIAPDETLSLNLETHPRRAMPANIPMRPPKVPEKWRALVDSRPPRDVYLPPAFWKSFASETIVVVGTVLAYQARAAKHHVPFSKSPSFDDPASLIIILSYTATWAVRVHKLLTTRQVVRDGEVSVAYTTARSWNRATYQFWTQTGESFERRTSLVTRPDTPLTMQIVPVFYLPDNPRKSVALYATEFRVRLAGADASRQLKNVPVKS
jgi:hypothetical protein